MRARLIAVGGVEAFNNVGAIVEKALELPIPFFLRNRERPVHHFTPEVSGADDQQPVHAPALCAANLLSHTSAAP